MPTDPSTAYLKLATPTPWFIYDRNSPEDRRWKVPQIFTIRTASVLSRRPIFYYLALILLLIYLKQADPVEEFTFDRASLLVTGNPTGDNRWSSRQRLHLLEITANHVRPVSRPYH